MMSDRTSLIASQFFTEEKLREKPRSELIFGKTSISLTDEITMTPIEQFFITHKIEGSKWLDVLQIMLSPDELTPLGVQFKILDFLSRRKEEVKKEINDDPSALFSEFWQTVLIKFHFSVRDVFRELVNTLHQIPGVFTCLFTHARFELLQEIEQFCELEARIMLKTTEPLFLRGALHRYDSAKQIILSIDRLCGYVEFLIETARVSYLSNRVIFDICVKLISHSSDERCLPSLVKFMFCVNHEGKFHNPLLIKSILDEFEDSIVLQKSFVTLCCHIIPGITKEWFESCDHNRFCDTETSKVEEELIETAKFKTLKQTLEVFKQELNPGTKEREEAVWKEIKKFIHIDNTDFSKISIALQHVGALILSELISRKLTGGHYTRYTQVRKLLESGVFVNDALLKNLDGLKEVIRRIVLNDEPGIVQTVFSLRHTMYSKIFNSIVAPTVQQSFIELLMQTQEQIKNRQGRRTFGEDWKIRNKIDTLLKFFETGRFETLEWIFKNFEYVFRWYSDEKQQCLNLVKFFCAVIRQTENHPMKFYADIYFANLLSSGGRLKIETIMRNILQYQYLIGEQSMKYIFWRIDHLNIMMPDYLRHEMTQWINRNFKEFVKAVVYAFCEGKTNWLQRFFGPSARNSVIFSSLFKFEYCYKKMTLRSGRCFRPISSCWIGPYTTDDDFTTGIDWREVVEFIAVKKEVSVLKCLECTKDLIQDDADYIYTKPNSSHGWFACQRCFLSDSTLTPISCGVCLAENAQLPVVLKCKHVLCQTCFEILHQNKTAVCPYCKEKIDSVVEETTFEKKIKISILIDEIVSGGGF